MTLSRDDLLKERFGIEEVEIGGLGTVKVRGLTRSEALAIKNKEIEVLEFERYMISRGMVEPKLTEDDVKKWQDMVPAGELEPVTRAIIRLSGMEEAAEKEAAKRFQE